MRAGLRGAAWRVGTVLAVAVIALPLVCEAQVIAVDVGTDQSFDSAPSAPTTTPTTSPASQAFSQAEYTNGVNGWPTLDRSDMLVLTLAGVALALIFATRWQRLNRVPLRPEAFSPAAALYLLGAMYLLGALGAAGAQTFLGIGDPRSPSAPLTVEQTAQLVLAATAARGLGVIAFVALGRKARRIAPDTRSSLLAATGLGVAALMLAWPLVAASTMVVGWATGAPEDPIAHDLLRLLAQSPLNLWSLTLIALVVIAGPIIEEVMYRGLLQEGLRRIGMRPWHAIAIASAVFAVAHVGVAQPHALAGLFMLALGLGWAYEKTGRLWAPIVMHALFNAGNLLLARASAS